MSQAQAQRTKLKHGMSVELTHFQLSILVHTVIICFDTSRWMTIFTAGGILLQIMLLFHEIAFSRLKIGG